MDRVNNCMYSKKYFIKNNFQIFQKDVSKISLDKVLIFETSFRYDI